MASTKKSSKFSSHERDIIAQLRSIKRMAHAGHTVDAAFKLGQLWPFLTLRISPEILAEGDDLRVHLGIKRFI
jgi:hypothetical protein